MDNLVYKEALKLTEQLLATTSPTGKVSALNIPPCHKVEKGDVTPCYLNSQTLNLLLAEGVIKFINIVKEDKNAKNWIYKVSFRRNKAEDFLHVIHHGNFAWDKRYGLWTYKDKSKTFKPGTGQYRVINMFMESPYRGFSKQVIIDTHEANSRDAGIKQIALDIIKEIKKPLKIPKEHFVPVADGYIFKP